MLFSTFCICNLIVKENNNSTWMFLSLMNLKLVVFFNAFWCFLVLFVLVKSDRKKNKKFKTGLMTSFILLLSRYPFSILPTLTHLYCVREFFKMRFKFAQRMIYFSLSEAVYSKKQFVTSFIKDM